MCILYIYIYIWVSYNISLTWIKAILGWFPLLTMIPVRSQWGRYNLPRYIYIYWFHPHCWLLNPQKLAPSTFIEGAISVMTQCFWRVGQVAKVVICLVSGCLRYLYFLLPSGKHTKNYGKIPLVLWPFSIANCLFTRGYIPKIPDDICEKSPCHRWYTSVLQSS